MRTSFARKPLLHLFVIAAMGLLAYSNTFRVPFQWDEHSFIADNPIIKDMSYFLKPSTAKDLEYYDGLRNRYVGYLSFALNYRLHGLDVTGYHIFNFSVHLINALLVYFLAVLSFKSPVMSESRLKEQSSYVGFFAALLFVTHPVQTEAVTYIFQRLASLAAMFYLLSIVLYIKYRLIRENDRRRGDAADADIHEPPLYRSVALYSLSIFSAVLAMKTKENAFTLPVVICLFEFFLFTGALKRRIIRLIPFALTFLIIPFTLLADLDRPIDEAVRGLAGSGMYHDVSRQEYFYTELRVIATYLRLLLLPTGQNIDRDYSIYHSFFDVPVLLSFLFFLALLGLAVYFFLRLRFKSPASRLAVLGIFWFFITISIESSMIMLPTIIDEYRLYLPSVGFFLSVVTGAFMLMKGVRSRTIQRAMMFVVVALPLFFAYAAYLRNNIWKTNMALWEDVVDKSPVNARGRLNLGLSYSSKGLTDMAIEQFHIALRLQPEYAEAHNNLGLAYHSKGMFEEAVNHFRRAIKIDSNFAEAHNNLGVTYEATGLLYKAIEEYNVALKIRPEFADARNNLGVALASRGDFINAVGHYQTALKYKPDDINIRYNLGLAYLSMGKREKALSELLHVVGENPEHEAKRFVDYIRAGR